MRGILLIKRLLLVTVLIIIVALSTALYLIWPIIFGGGFHDITRQNGDLIRQMKSSGHGRLIRRVIVAQRLTIYIDIFVRRSASGEEILALVEEIKPLIDDTFPALIIPNVTGDFPCVSLNIGYVDFRLYQFEKSTQMETYLPSEWTLVWRRDGH